MIIGLVTFKKQLTIEDLKNKNWPTFILEKWCSGCKFEFLSDDDYESKKVLIHNFISEEFK